MPHIHNGAGEHDLTVTAHIIRTDTDEPQALVHMHKKLHRLLPVGGHVEVSETPWQAIAHEVEEEAGYDFETLQILQPVTRIKAIGKVALHPYPIAMNTHAITDAHYHTDIEYGFITDQAPTLAVGDGESTDLRWLTQTELAALTPDVIYDSTKDVYNFIFDEVLGTWDALPTDTFER